MTRAFTGFPARVIGNRFQQEYEQSQAPVLPGLLQAVLEQDIWMAAARQNAPDYFPLYAGQSVGVINDLPGAAEVVSTIMREAEAVMARLSNEHPAPAPSTVAPGT